MNTQEPSFRAAYVCLINSLKSKGIDVEALELDLQHADELNEVEPFSPKYHNDADEYFGTIYYKLSDICDRHSLQLGYDIQHKIDESKLVILTTNNEKLRKNNDWPVYAKSPEQALAAFKDMAITRRVFIDNITVSKSVIEFYFKGESILKIEPLRFKEVSESGSLQAESCFKGLQESELNTLRAKLSKLPGMKDIKVEKSEKSLGGPALHPTLKNTAIIIKKFLMSNGIDLPLNVAQEAAAQFLTGSSWQVALSSFNKNLTLPPAHMSFGDYFNESKIEYYRTLVDGAWDFCKEVESKSLLPEVYLGFTGAFRTRFHASKSGRNLVYNSELDQADFDSEINLSSLEEVDFDEDAIDEFEGVISSDDNLTTKHLREIFYADLPANEKVRSMNKGAHNDNPSDFIIAKGLMFSIDTRNREMLRVEDAGQDELPSGEPIYMAIYKGELRQSKDGFWVLMADYGNQVFKELPLFDDDDASKLAKFCGVNSIPNRFFNSIKTIDEGSK